MSYQQEIVGGYFLAHPVQQIITCCNCRQDVWFSFFSRHRGDTFLRSQQFGMVKGRMQNFVAICARDYGHKNRENFAYWQYISTSYRGDSVGRFLRNLYGLQICYDDFHSLVTFGAHRTKLHAKYLGSGVPLIFDACSG